jgi:hypothetical protein
MMNIAIDHKWRVQVAKMLGLDPELVTKVELCIPCDDVATVKVTALLSQDVAEFVEKKYAEVRPAEAAEKQ